MEMQSAAQTWWMRQAKCFAALLAALLIGACGRSGDSGGTDVKAVTVDATATAARAIIGAALAPTPAAPETPVAFQAQASTDRATLRLAPTPAPPTDYLVVLQGSHSMWTHTGILLAAGDKLRFSASGKIYWDPAVREPEVGPNGASWNPSQVTAPHEFLLRNVPIVSLIGQIGDHLFPIGAESAIYASSAGELLLGINERWVPGAWEDNHGHFEVNIHVDRKD